MGSLLKKGAPAIVQGTLIPLAIFYVVLWAGGMWAALMAAVAWSYLLIVRRVVRREPISGLVILGALALSFRTALSMFTGSVVIYFLQPSLGTALVGLAFLFSMASRQPLIQRLARDFLPVPPEFFDDPSVRRFFKRISPVWAVMMLANATITAWMLFSIPIELFQAARTVVSGVIVGAVVGYSVFGLRRLLTAGAPNGTVKLRSAGRNVSVLAAPLRGITRRFALRRPDTMASFSVPGGITRPAGFVSHPLRMV